MSQVKANTTTKQTTFRARKKAILEWEDFEPVVEHIAQTFHEDSDSDSEGEDFWDNFDAVVDNKIYEMKIREFGEIQKSIQKDWLKFGLMIMSQGLKEISAIEMSLARPLVVAKPTPKPVALKNPFDSFWKIPLILGEKRPVFKGWEQPAKHQKAAINPRRYNTGVITGERNNLLIVDLDVKDDGVEEFKKYIQTFGKPQTLHVRTPSGGEHYYFNYVHPDPGTNQMIKQFLTNTP